MSGARNRNVGATLERFTTILIARLPRPDLTGPGKWTSTRVSLCVFIFFQLKAQEGRCDMELNITAVSDWRSYYSVCPIAKYSYQAIFLLTPCVQVNRLAITQVRINYFSTQSLMALALKRHGFPVASIEAIVAAFICSCGAILVLTTAAKTVGVFGNSLMLEVPDVLFPVNNRTLLSIAAAGELGAVAIMLGSGRREFKLKAILWICMIFSIYRLGSWLMGQSSCPCLGPLIEDLPFSPQVVSRMLTGLLVYMCGGSLVLLLILRYKSLRAPRYNESNDA